MTYKCLMVHLGPDGDNERLLAITGDIAERLGASVIGIAARQPIRPFTKEGILVAELVKADDRKLRKELAASEAVFRAALASRVRNLEWRSTITYGSLADFIAEESRAADLIIVGPDRDESVLEDTLRINIGDLVMRAGKPVLIIPKKVSKLSLNHVFVGWKEVREARRAVQNALPFLNLATKTSVLEVTSDKDISPIQAHTKDVCSWLGRHGTIAEPIALSAPGMEIPAFHRALRDGQCDLLVAGAYGHSRLGEWVFGGVTKDILLDPERCVLISH